MDDIRQYIDEILSEKLKPSKICFLTTGDKHEILPAGLIAMDAFFVQNIRERKKETIKKLFGLHEENPKYDLYSNMVLLNVGPDEVSLADKDRLTGYYREWFSIINKENKLDLFNDELTFGLKYILPRIDLEKFFNELFGPDSLTLPGKGAAVDMNNSNPDSVLGYFLIKYMLLNEYCDQKGSVLFNDEFMFRYIFRPEKIRSAGYRILKKDLLNTYDSSENTLEEFGFY